jgi:dephospho-CoA kinase
MSMIICITGGIGSGKSTVCKYLEERGYPVYYSDVRAKALMEGDSKFENNSSLFLALAYTRNSEALNRPELARNF